MLYKISLEKIFTEKAGRFAEKMEILCDGQTVFQAVGAMFSILTAKKKFARKEQSKVKKPWLLFQDADNSKYGACLLKQFGDADQFTAIVELKSSKPLAFETQDYAKLKIHGGFTFNKNGDPPIELMFIYAAPSLKHVQTLKMSTLKIFARSEWLTRDDFGMFSRFFSVFLFLFPPFVSLSGSGCR